jgi:aldose 1-epimerase
MRGEPATFPSGEQHVIRAGDHVAIVTEVGATLRSFAVDGRSVLDGFAAEEISTAGRGQVLAPWPNRLQDGRYSYAGRDGRAALDEPERGNAIHGLVRWLPWAAQDRDAASVSLGCMLDPQPAYPWRLELRIDYRVSDDGLTITTEATNRSDMVAPFGLGFHPYFTLGTDGIDEVTLSVPARRRLLTDERGLPVGQEEISGTALDFSDPRRIGATVMDTCYIDLLRGDDGRVTVALGHTDTTVAVWMQDAFRAVMVYTGDTLEPAERRRRSIAIEPMTCPPNALRLGEDLIGLEPDRTWRAEWGIAT